MGDVHFPNRWDRQRRWQQEISKELWRKDLDRHLGAALSVETICGVLDAELARYARRPAETAQTKKLGDMLANASVSQHNRPLLRLKTWHQRASGVLTVDGLGGR
jgi:hypothetical protein